MFTGIVEEQGKLISTVDNANGKQLKIEAKTIHNKIKIGDSIAINGVCQTVTKIINNTFYVDTVHETLKKTLLGKIKIGSNVNLELALTPNSRLGGHFVQGHVDTIGKIIQISKNSNIAEFYISFPATYRKYLAPTGSIAIDGVSLTTSEVFPTKFKVAIIPHTLKNTLFTQYKIDDKVNLEFDIIGKYIDTILKNANENNIDNSLSKYISQPEL